MEEHHNSSTITKPDGIDITSPEGIEKVKAIFEEQHISLLETPDSSREQIWLSGNLDTFLATSEDTGGQYALFDLYVPPQSGPVTHLHTREDEVYKVLDGEVTFQEGNQIKVATPRDLIPLDRGHIHRFKNLGAEPARMLLLATPSGLDKFFREGGQAVTDPSLPPPKDDFAKLQAAASNDGIQTYPEASLLGEDKLIPGTAPAAENGSVFQAGNDGNDVFTDGDGNDIYLGGNGNNSLSGGKGDDILIGGNGDDHLDGGQGNDIISGREGNNTLTGGGGRDAFFVPLGDGTDNITDFSGVGTQDNLSGAAIAEVDVLKFEGTGLVARNMLLAQDGSDLLINFEGGDNTRVKLQNFALENLDNFSTPIVASTSVNIGNVLFDGQNGLSAIKDSFDVFDANQQSSNVLHQNSVTFLNELDNTISGFDNSNDVINGQGGNDQLSGLSGDDLLRGGNGNDTLIGGFGNDSLNGGNGNDLFVLTDGAGTDSIIDFTKAQDLIGLSDGLRFADLKITQGTGVNANDTLISTSSGSELLAILNEVQASNIMSADFSIV